jgi:flagellar biosynthesis protein FlhG
MKIVDISPRTVSRMTQFNGPETTRVIAVASGKGGVGKTTVSINLALALAEKGKKVMLMDADLGLANIDVMLGIKPKMNLAHVLRGECELDDIIVTGPRGIKILPAASGVKQMADLTPPEQAGLIHAFSTIKQRSDVLLVDTAAGIASSTIKFCTAAQEVLLVVCNEPASITDAYATIKILNQNHGINRFRILANMAQDAIEGARIFQKLVDVTERFLNVSLDLVGTVPYDINSRKIAQQRKAIFDVMPSSATALAFKKLADRTDKWSVPIKARGNLEFFVEQLVQAQSMERRVQL